MEEHELASFHDFGHFFGGCFIGNDLPLYAD
jgi:hypothetical protein